MKQKQEALTVNLMRELARASEDETLQTKLKTEGCFVLTKHKAMRRNSETFLDDAQWTNGNADAETLHGKVGNDEGRALGCSSVRDELARRCEEGGFGGDEAFGQQERLSDRISSLLHDYNRPEDVFTEHWQNSDDAGAERLLFMIDHTNYPTTSLVDHRASTLQGPALILASSKPLSNDDMARIQSLGDSHKCKDFSSVGRFGVGITLLYHISDTPVLLANDALHVFDPLQNVVATDKSNGKKWSLEKLEREGFNHMLTPFAQLKDWPTIFRLPLRRNCSSSWKTALCTWTEESLQSLLDSFSGRMHVEERLVLAKHVRSVTFSVKRNESFEPKAKFETAS